MRDKAVPRTGSRRKRFARLLLAAAVCLLLLIGAGWIGLTSSFSGVPSEAARSTGNDAEWLGHAWVDGRKGQSDVDALAKQLSQTGIRDLFVHAGPFRNDGTLDASMRPKAVWLTGALHAALPGVRVQAWLGAHPVPGEMSLASASTRAAVLVSVEQILAEGFDGIHYDFEPVDDGNAELITMLSETRPVTKRRGAMLSVSAIHLEPWAGTAAAVSIAPGRLALWSPGYLARVAREVDQIAIMSYDTGLPTEESYGGYVRRTTEAALKAVPPEVTLFIGVPAYQDERLFRRDSAETMAAALRGIRLALGAQPPNRAFGVAIYVDFDANAEDWASYFREWARCAS